MGDRPDRCELTGVVCHVGLYCFVPPASALLQCLFLEIRGQGPPALRTFAVRCAVPPGPEGGRYGADYLNKTTFLSLLRRPESERPRYVKNRRDLLCRTLLAGSRTLAALCRVFVPVAVRLDPKKLEILEAKRIDEPFPGFVEAVRVYDVARLAVVGSYGAPEEAPSGAAGAAGGGEGGGGGGGAKRRREEEGKEKKEERGEGEEEGERRRRGAGDARQVLAEYGTHARKKLSRGYGVSGVAFSLTFNGAKHIFEEDRDAGEWPLRRVFDVRDAELAGGPRVRFATPAGFLAIAAADDQCYLALRAALGKLHRAVYFDFGGLQPVFDYLGPDIVVGAGDPEEPPRGAADRSVFFSGFPWVYVYFVPYDRRLADETARDAVRTRLCDCGLPDVLGRGGKLEASVVRPSPFRLPAEELDVFSYDARPFRLNGGVFRERAFEIMKGERVPVQIGVADGREVCRIVFPDLRLHILRRCMPARDFSALLLGEPSAGRASPPSSLSPPPLSPAGRGDGGGDGGGARLGPSETCAAFLRGLRLAPGDLYARVRGVENYLSQHVTSACTAAGFAWVLVRDGCEFYVAPGGSAYGASVETCVRTVFSCHWQRLFRDALPEPACFLVERSHGVMLVRDDRLVSGFARADGRPRDWLDVAVAAVAVAVAELRADAGWACRDNLRGALRPVLLRFVGARHDPAFWVERFEPGRWPVADHDGVIDCSRFSGVFAEGERVVPQPYSGCALHDEISYRSYVERVLRLLRLFADVALEASSGGGAGNGNNGGNGSGASPSPSLSSSSERGAPPAASGGGSSSGGEGSGNNGGAAGGGGGVRAARAALSGATVELVADYMKLFRVN